MTRDPIMDMVKEPELSPGVRDINPRLDDCRYQVDIAAQAAADGTGHAPWSD